MSKIRKVFINVVRGSDGFSLQIVNEHGGERYAGPKAWGNPYNVPTASFEVDVDDFIRAIERNAYEVEEGDE